MFELTTPPPPPPPPDWDPWGRNEVAEFMAVPLDTVDTWRKRGRLPEPWWPLFGGPTWARWQIECWSIESGREAARLDRHARAVAA